MFNTWRELWGSEERDISKEKSKGGVRTLAQSDNFPFEDIDKILGEDEEGRWIKKTLKVEARKSYLRL